MITIFYNVTTKIATIKNNFYYPLFFLIISSEIDLGTSS